MKVNTKNQKAVAEAYAALDARASKDAAKMITESWAPMIERTTGVKDTNKLEWMSQLAHNTAKNLNEDAFQVGLGANNPNSTFGGVYSPYSTLYNTPGVGNVVPAGKPALTGSDYANDQLNGSGDKYPALLPLALKVAAKTIGFELVNTTPLAGPSGVLPYMDYVYAGSKQPYGATPAYAAANANPRWTAQANNTPYALYGLPHAFKAALVADSSVSVLNAKKALMDGGLKAGVKLANDALSVEFVGWSRIDGDPMFKVVNGNASLGETFANGEVTLTGEGVTMTLRAPKLISMLEDSLQGSFPQCLPGGSLPGLLRSGPRFAHPHRRCAAGRRHE